MKKFFALICMITCIFGLTACGSEETLTDNEQKKLAQAEYMATDMVVPYLMTFMDDSMTGYFDGYTAQEITNIVFMEQNLSIDGYVMRTAIESFHSAKDAMGNPTEVAGVTSRIDDDTIIVEVSVSGEKKDAVAEIIFSNDWFLEVESASLNPVSTMGELMERAALNTVIGMGTVFAVLILISFIISAFSLIPKMQAKFAKKKEVPAAVVEEKTQAAVQEEVTDEADDLELAAVIAAAVAAYEGSASTDGFIVRSIRRRA